MVWEYVAKWMTPVYITVKHYALWDNHSFWSPETIGIIGHLEDESFVLDEDEDL